MIFSLVKKDVNCLVIIKDNVLTLKEKILLILFDAYGIQEPNIELPSDFNNFELHEESSLEAIPTDFEKSDIRPNSDGENAAVFVNPFVIFIRGAKMLQGNNKMV